MHIIVMIRAHHGEVSRKVVLDVRTDGNVSENTQRPKQLWCVCRKNLKIGSEILTLVTVNFFYSVKVNRLSHGAPSAGI